MIGEEKMDTCCEHCRKDRIVNFLDAGRHWTYRCAKGVTIGDFLWGAINPCDGNSDCCVTNYDEPKYITNFTTKSLRRNPKRYSFPYKRIPLSQIKRTRKGIEADAEKRRENKAVAKELREQATELLNKARELEC